MISPDSRLSTGTILFLRHIAGVGWLFPPSDRAISPSVYFTRKTDTARSYWKKINSPSHGDVSGDGGEAPRFSHFIHEEHDKDGSCYYGNSNSLFTLKKSHCYLFPLFWNTVFSNPDLLHFYQLTIILRQNTIRLSLYGYKWQPYTATLTQGIS
jgi:hypothetical protein